MKRSLDMFLNRFSMYRFVSIMLAVLLASAVAYSTVGILSYSVVEILLSAVVLLAGVYGISLLAGKIFRVPVHGESSFITAAILTLIMTPTDDTAGLFALFAVGCIAGASKFLLTWHGRHIFNPAALGAFVASTIGLAYASWWVATPPLLLVTLLATVLILYKIGHLRMGAIFLITASLLLLVVFQSYGVELTAGIALLASWPLLFFAGFMLTEPLTLASRRMHQYVEAALVAVLFSVPLSFGDFSMTPALALLIGNTYAAIVSMRHAVSLSFVKRTPLTPTSDELVFRGGRDIPFMPGQYAELTLSHEKKDGRGARRMFSVTSVKNGVVTFGVKFYNPSSSFKTKLRSLKKGDRVQLTRIDGDFVVPKDPHTPIVFFAGGIGITPFISYLRHTVLPKNSFLVYAIRSHDELAYVEEVQSAGVSVIVVSPDTTPLKMKQWKKHTADYVTADTLALLPGDLSRYAAYISGPPQFVRAVKRVIKGRVARMRTDYFTGY